MLREQAPSCVPTLMATHVATKTESKKGTWVSRNGVIKMRGLYCSLRRRLEKNLDIFLDNLTLVLILLTMKENSVLY